MRLLLTIHHQLDRDSGAPGATLALRDAFAGAGCEVEVFSHDDLPRFARGRLALLLFPLFVAARVLCRPASKRYDWVECSTGDGWLLGLAPRWARPGLSLRSHGLEHVAHERLLEQVRSGDETLSRLYWLYRGSVHLGLIGLQARRSDLCLVLNKDEQRLCEERLGIPSERVVLTPNGVPNAWLEAALAHDLEPAGDSPISIAYVGSYIRRKGTDELERAVPDFLEAEPGRRLHLLGVGAEADEILRRYPESVRDRVAVTPRFSHDQLPDLLAGGHVFVLPSHNEGFSLSVVEAMACGLAPLLSDRTGACDFLAHDQEAVVIPSGDHAALRDALERFDRDRAWLHRVRSEARAAVAQFTWEAIAERTASAYRARLRQPTSSAAEVLL